MNYLPDEEYARIYNQVPRACVDVMVTDHRNFLLLSRRKIPPFAGFWHLPGGRIRFKESVPDAAKRITLAETGLTLIGMEIVGSIDILHDDVAGPSGEVWPRHSVSIVVEAQTEGELKADYQSSEFDWFEVLPSREEMHPDHYEYLKNWIFGCV